MAYVIDGKTIRITDRYANSYFIALDKISLMAFQNDSLDIYIENHKVRLNETDYLGVEEVRRIYYSLLTALSAGRAPANIAPTTTAYGSIPQSAMTRPLAMARGSGREKDVAKKEDREEKKEKSDNILRMSKPKK